jgi:hypothetical protein
MGDEYCDFGAKMGEILYSVYTELYHVIIAYIHRYVKGFGRYLRFHDGSVLVTIRYGMMENPFLS